MTRLFFFLFFVAMAALPACNHVDYDESTYVELKKDPCFGFCPVYTFRVDGSGKATFEGIRNVDKQGHWERQLPKEEVAALFNAFLEADFWSFEDEYTDQVSDLPTVWVTFSHKGQTKQVKDYFGAPPKLKELEALVEEIAESTTGWQQVTSSE
ncbi:MAG: hypothetical protein D6816_00085 [Bacteroidetes bacterium]|nr:MAG: hypothetical protein D6816_00085 [Bacteroidota bacterium]